MPDDDRQKVIVSVLAEAGDANRGVRCCNLARSAAASAAVLRSIDRCRRDS
jgi:hypothetical protein